MADTWWDKAVDFAYQHGPEWLIQKIEARDLAREVGEQHAIAPVAIPDTAREAAEANRIYAQQAREEQGRADMGFQSRDDGPTVPQWLQEYEENLRAASPQVARAQPIAEVREERHDEIARKLREVAPSGPEAPAPAYQPTKSAQYVEEHRYHEKTAPQNVVEFKPQARDDRQHSWDWGR
jgi:hypothetical protein